MKGKSITIILSLLFGLLHTFLIQAQDVQSCSATRQSSVKRQAIATPEHVRLMNQYDVSFYELNLQLERNTTFIAGHVTIVASIKAPTLETFAFELHPNFQIDSVIVNGSRQQSINRNSSNVSVALITPVAPTSKLTATVYYKGTAPRSNNAAIGNGFNTATENTWGNQVTWSLSEPYAAYEWWPTKQVLTDKADSAYVFVTTSTENKVGSNGLLTNTVPLPGNKVRYEWKTRYPIAYYLISVAMSDYEEYLIYTNTKGAPKPIPILNYVYRGGALNKFKSEIDLTAPLIEHFSDLFTLYPFAAEKYGHSMAPMNGGMEHQTMTTQSTFFFTLTAHELAHQWFGDNVTCASWQDIWLNEGFASYAEFLALERFGQPGSASSWMDNAHASVLQQPGGSVLVPDTSNVSRIFSGRLTYKKGATVVHMLRYTINNDALFFEALRRYQQQFGGGTATTADLQQVFEQVTGQNLDYFFEQWYKGEGAPVFAVEWNQEGDKLLLQTTQTSTGSTPFFKTDVDYLVRTASGVTTFRVTQDDPEEQYLLKVRDEEIISIEIDPNQQILNTTLQVVKNTNLKIPAEFQLNTMVYPNPASAYLKLVNLTFNPTIAEIFDRTGRLVSKQQLSLQTEVSMNIADLPAGLYILRVTNDSEIFRSSFIKLP
ncbi:M1 family aminopeptidase [Pontibacter ruber]|uniref:Aminopeptidase N n=1 Tax=Pontibacter ruber TaxID=1343895 RepID=A0ABW5CY67_9BACT|nr:M1 family aminopeptidase [Pontibacter ruber]